MAEEVKPFRVFMWCVPRSISTAITKCFSKIDNTQVWFEPYWVRCFQELLARAKGWYPDRTDEPFDVGRYLATNQAMLKGTPSEVYFSTDNVDETLVSCVDISSQLNNLPSNKSVFIKDMTVGIANNFQHLPNKGAGFKYTFLIRDPERVMPSLRNLFLRQNPPLLELGKVDPASYDFLENNPFMDEGYFYKAQYDLWKYVKDNIDPNPVVVDSDELLANPAAILPLYFKACGMPWNDSLLEWDPSSDVAKTWKVLFPVTPGTHEEGKGSQKEKYVMDNAHSTTLSSGNFLPSKPKLSRERMTPDVIKAIEATSHYYEEMAATRIKTDSPL